MIAKVAMTFAGMFVLDFLWAQYVMHTADRSKLRSSAFATVIILATGFVTIQYTQDARMLIPAAFGAFLGTWAAMWWEERASTARRRQAGIGTLPAGIFDRRH